MFGNIGSLLVVLINIVYLVVHDDFLFLHLDYLCRQLV